MAEKRISRICRHKCGQMSQYSRVVVVVVVAVVTAVFGPVGSNELPGIIVMDQRSGSASNSQVDAHDGLGDAVRNGGWGFQDQTALVGRLFEYRLANSDVCKILNVASNCCVTPQTGACDSKVGLYAGSACGQRRLMILRYLDAWDCPTDPHAVVSEVPSWLHYDATSGLLEGVPLSEDLGKTFQVSVTVSTDNSSPTVDTFEVQVTDETVLPSSAQSEQAKTEDEIPRSVKCLPSSSVTTATVLVDVDFLQMQPAERSALIRDFSTHLDLPVAAVRVIAASDGRTPVDDGSALVAGLGNAPAGDTERPRSLMQWEVGCGNVFAPHMAVLQKVEKTALDGTMARKIGHNVVGWHVVNKKPTLLSRHRRLAPRLFATPTPTMAVTPPTSRPVPTTTVTQPRPTAIWPIIPTVQEPSSTVRPPRTKKPTRAPKPPRATAKPTITPRPLPSTSTTAKLEPSVAVRSTTKVTSQPTPALLPTSQTPTVHPPLEWTSNFRVVSASVNQIVDVPMPDDAFRGRAPGTLTIRLLTEDGLQASLSWLKWNDTSRRFYGMPMNTHVGSREFVVVATDRDGNEAQGKFRTEVVSRQQVVHPAFESSATLNVDYDKFCENDVLRMDVANKIARAFGDPDARNLAITRVAKGSVVISWTNSSMSGDGACPGDEVTEVQSKMFNEDGTLRESFQKAIEPYVLLGAEMSKRGACGSETVKATAPDSPQAPSSTTAYAVGPNTQPATAGGGNATVIIVVLIVIAVIVLITVILCCIVCRRRRRSKSFSPDKKIKPGAPIILAYELDDMASQTTPSKPLIGTGAERPPAPPDYQLATGASPPTDNRQPLLSSDTGADQMSPLKFQPPPGSATSRGQPPAAGQRRPPAYASAT